MQAVVITRHGPPEVLEIQERPDPTPGPGQLVVDVRACGVNFADLMARLGFYPDAPKTPCVVGYEVAGEVAEVGEGVTAYKPGDRVMAGTRFGGYASRVAVDARDAIALPERLSFAQGAAIPVNYATAWCAIRRYGAGQAGERMLVHAAAGGVGIAATQLGKRYGLEVHGAASPGKHDAIRAFGVDVAHDYTRSGWEKGIGPFDLVLDAIGGASFRRSYELLRPGGRLIAFGASAVVSGEKRDYLSAVRTMVRMPRFNLVKQMSDSKAVIGLNALRLWDEAGTLEPWIAPLSELIDDGTIQPVVAEEVPFARAADAHRALSERRNVGKVVLVP